MDFNNVARSCLPDARAQDTVVMALLPNGRQVKVTGHARAQRWNTAPTNAPSSIKVICVEVSSEEAAGRLYEAFEHLLGAEMM